MLQKWIEALTDLPVIVQSALGSALFALLLLLGQFTFRILSAKYSHSNKRRRRRFLRNEIAKIQVIHAKEHATKSAYLSLLIYRASRSFAKAFIWLTLGLLFGSIGQGFGVAGYLGAIYYFFSALSPLRAPSKTGDKSARLLELRAELKALGDGT
ncbi:MAG: hypothetical protein ACYC0F_18350 [Rhodanobacter sp.]